MQLFEREKLPQASEVIYIIFIRFLFILFISSDRDSGCRPSFPTCGIYILQQSASFSGLEKVVFTCL